jgi:hypothetical protein
VTEGGSIATDPLTEEDFVMLIAVGGVGVTRSPDA